MSPTFTELNALSSPLLPPSLLKLYDEPPRLPTRHRNKAATTHGSPPTIPPHRGSRTALIPSLTFTVLSPTLQSHRMVPYPLPLLPEGWSHKQVSALMSQLHVQTYLSYRNTSATEIPQLQTYLSCRRTLATEIPQLQTYPITSLSTSQSMIFSSSGLTMSGSDEAPPPVIPPRSSSVRLHPHRNSGSSFGSHESLEGSPVSTPQVHTRAGTTIIYWKARSYGLETKYVSLCILLMLSLTLTLTLTLSPSHPHSPLTLILSPSHSPSHPHTHPLTLSHSNTHRPTRQ